MRANHFYLNKINQFGNQFEALLNIIQKIPNDQDREMKLELTRDLLGAIQQSHDQIKQKEYRDIATF